MSEGQAVDPSLVLQLVARVRELYGPTPSDLERMCWSVVQRKGKRKKTDVQRYKLHIASCTVIQANDAAITTLALQLFDARDAFFSRAKPFFCAVRSLTR